MHDAVAGSIYLAEYANAKKLNKWATCSPDYAYGRDTTAQYLQFFKQFKPDVEIVTDAWPKLGQPDFTEVITKLIQAAPKPFLRCSMPATSRLSSTKATFMRCSRR